MLSLSHCRKAHFLQPLNFDICHLVALCFTGRPHRNHAESIRSIDSDRPTWNLPRHRVRSHLRASISGFVDFDGGTVHRSRCRPLVQKAAESFVRELDGRAMGGTGPTDRFQQFWHAGLRRLRGAPLPHHEYKRVGSVRHKYDCAVRHVDIQHDDSGVIGCAGSKYCVTEDPLGQRKIRNV